MYSPSTVSSGGVSLAEDGAAQELNHQLRSWTETRGKLEELIKVQSEQEEAFVRTIEDLFARAILERADHQNAMTIVTGRLQTAHEEKSKAIDLFRNFRAKGTSMMRELRGQLDTVSDRYRIEEQKARNLGMECMYLKGEAERQKNLREKLQMSFQQAPNADYLGMIGNLEEQITFFEGQRHRWKITETEYKDHIQRLERELQHYQQGGHHSSRGRLSPRSSKSITANPMLLDNNVNSVGVDKEELQRMQQQWTHEKNQLLTVIEQLKNPPATTLSAAEAVAILRRTEDERDEESKAKKISERRAEDLHARLVTMEAECAALRQRVHELEKGKRGMQEKLNTLAEATQDDYKRDSRQLFAMLEAELKKPGSKDTVEGLKRVLEIQTHLCNALMQKLKAEDYQRQRTEEQCAHMVGEAEKRVQRLENEKRSLHSASRSTDRDERSTLSPHSIHSLMGTPHCPTVNSSLHSSETPTGANSTLLGMVSSGRMNTTPMHTPHSSHNNTLNNINHNFSSRSSLTSHPLGDQHSNHNTQSPISLPIRIQDTTGSSHDPHPLMHPQHVQHQTPITKTTTEGFNSTHWTPTTTPTRGGGTPTTTTTTTPQYSQRGYSTDPPQPHSTPTNYAQQQLPQPMLTLQNLSTNYDVHGNAGTVTHHSHLKNPHHQSLLSSVAKPPSITDISSEISADSNIDFRGSSIDAALNQLNGEVQSNTLQWGVTLNQHKAGTPRSMSMSTGGGGGNMPTMNNNHLDITLNEDELSEYMPDEEQAAQYQSSHYSR